jgi:hypothetical protein
MKRTLPLILSAGLLLSSCMPTIQTPQGSVQVGFVTGTPYGLVQKTPLAQITDQTPPGSYVTFPDCQGGAIRLSDVRQYGPELTGQACRAGVQRSVDVQSVAFPFQLIIGLPLIVASGLLFKRFYDCGFPFGTCDSAQP